MVEVATYSSTYGVGLVFGAFALWSIAKNVKTDAKLDRIGRHLGLWE